MRVPEWLQKYPLTSNWQAHLDRGSPGGEDWALPEGTPLVAPSDCQVHYIANSGTAGHTAVMTRPDGTLTEYYHLSDFANGGKPWAAREGEIVGWSGGRPGSPGAGWSTGPHLHAHDRLASGQRVLAFSTITKKKRRNRMAQTLLVRKIVKGKSTAALVNPAAGLFFEFENQGTTARQFLNQIVGMETQSTELSSAVLSEADYERLRSMVERKNNE